MPAGRSSPLGGSHESLHEERAQRGGSRALEWLYLTPTLFQARIARRTSLRIMVVGRRVFSAMLSVRPGERCAERARRAVRAPLKSTPRMRSSENAIALHDERLGTGSSACARARGRRCSEPACRR
jgi:hypothetical protein